MMPPPSTNTTTAAVLTTKPSQRRSAAQRAAAQRLVQPKQQPTTGDERPSGVPAPLIGSESFYKHKQEGIRSYRGAYDSRVNAHFDALAAGSSGRRADAGGGAPPSTPTPPSDSIRALAHENASRHVAPISQMVRGVQPPPRGER